MKRSLLVAVLSLFQIGIAAGQGTTPPPAASRKTPAKSAPTRKLVAQAAAKKPPAGDTVPLNEAVAEVEKVLDAYQNLDDVKDGKLPGLATADFDFKTAVDTKGGISVSFLIFKIGASSDKQTTTDVDFQYQPMIPVQTESFTGAIDFEKQLTQTVMQAAQTVMDQKKIQEEITGVENPLVFKQMTVTVGYGVTTEIDASGTAVIHLVTLSGSLQHSKNSVQTVKLTFAPPSKPKAHGD